jgi:peptide/nickel transport system ATP-binding protein
VTDASTARVAAGGLDAVLTVRELRVAYIGGPSSRTLVSGVDLTVRAGETVGIVGESGSGKSLTARALTGLLAPELTATGQAVFEGRDLLSFSEREWRTVRGRGIGLVLQDPFTMLSPTMRCGNIIAESLPRGRRSRSTRRAEVLRRLAEVGIEDESVMDRYPFQLSGGMRQRVGIAAALARNPSVLIADEPTTALDVTTQKEILELMTRIQADRGMALILITHDLRVAFAMCDRVHVFYAGSVVEVGKSEELDALPLHPYTLGLLQSEPPVDQRVEKLVTIPGSVPKPDDVLDRCSFAARCHWSREVCTSAAPPIREISAGRLTACARIDEIEDELREARQLGSVSASERGSERAGTSIISARVVSKVFGSSGQKVVALDGVSIDVGEGESVGLVGESGSGKTTLARLMVGLETVTGGHLLIDGIDVRDWRDLKRAELRRLRQTVQMVFQDPYSSLNPARSVGWTLAEAVTTHAPDTRSVERRVGELLTSVGLSPDDAQRRPAVLSGGMRQRVAIARALAANPRILVCDEAVSALDVSVQAQILNLLTSLRDEQGIGYLFVTHDLSIVRQVTDFIYVMCRGRVVESGMTDDVLNAPQDPYTIKLMESMPRPDGSWLGR